MTSDRPRIGLRADLRGTLIATLVVTLSTVLVTRLLAQALGPIEFGRYIVARRMLSVLAPIVTLMVADGLVRFTAMSRAPRERRNWLFAGLLVAGIPSATVATLLVVFPGFLADLVIGFTPDGGVLAGFLCFLLGYSLHSVMYAMLRGTGDVHRANILNALIIGVLPVVAIAASDVEQAGLALLVVAGPFVLSAVFLLGVMASIKSPSPLVLGEVGEAMRTLVIYGGPRIPGALALNGILAFGPWLLGQSGNLSGAGHLGAGQLLLRVAEPGAVALGLVALPRVASMMANGQAERLKARLDGGLRLLLPLSLFASLNAPLWMPIGMTLLLGPEYQTAGTTASVVALGLGPYLCYVTLRSILDGMSIKAYNARNLVSALGIAAGLSWLLWRIWATPVAIAAALVVSFVLLGAATVRSLCGLTGTQMAQIVEWKSIGTVCVGAILAYISRATIPGLIPGYLVAATFQVLSGWGSWRLLFRTA